MGNSNFHKTNTTSELEFGVRANVLAHLRFAYSTTFLITQDSSPIASDCDHSSAGSLRTTHLTATLSGWVH